MAITNGNPFRTDEQLTHELSAPTSKGRHQDTAYGNTVAAQHRWILDALLTREKAKILSLNNFKYSPESHPLTNDENSAWNWVKRQFGLTRTQVVADYQAMMQRSSGTPLIHLAAEAKAKVPSSLNMHSSNLNKACLAILQQSIKDLNLKSPTTPQQLRLELFRGLEQNTLEYQGSDEFKAQLWQHVCHCVHNDYLFITDDEATLSFIANLNAQAAAEISLEENLHAKRHNIPSLIRAVDELDELMLADIYSYRFRVEAFIGIKAYESQTYSSDYTLLDDDVFAEADEHRLNDEIVKLEGLLDSERDKNTQANSSDAEKFYEKLLNLHRQQLDATVNGRSKAQLQQRNRQVIMREYALLKGMRIIPENQLPTLSIDAGAVLLTESIETCDRLIEDYSQASSAKPHPALQHLETLRTALCRQFAIKHPEQTNLDQVDSVTTKDYSLPLDKLQAKLGNVNEQLEKQLNLLKAKTRFANLDRELTESKISNVKQSIAELQKAVISDKDKETALKALSEKLPISPDHHQQAYEGLISSDTNKVVETCKALQSALKGQTGPLQPFSQQARQLQQQYPNSILFKDDPANDQLDLNWLEANIKKHLQAKAELTAKQDELNSLEEQLTATPKPTGNSNDEHEIKRLQGQITDLIQAAKTIATDAALNDKTKQTDFMTHHYHKLQQLHADISNLVRDEDKPILNTFNTNLDAKSTSANNLCFLAHEQEYAVLRNMSERLDQVKLHQQAYFDRLEEHQKKQEAYSKALEKYKADRQNIADKYQDGDTNADPDHVIAAWDKALSTANFVRPSSQTQEGEVKADADISSQGGGATDGGLTSKVKDLGGKIIEKTPQVVKDGVHKAKEALIGPDANNLHQYIELTFKDKDQAEVFKKSLSRIPATNHCEAFLPDAQDDQHPEKLRITDLDLHTFKDSLHGAKDKLNKNLLSINEPLTEPQNSLEKSKKEIKQLRDAINELAGSNALQEQKDKAQQEKDLNDAIENLRADMRTKAVNLRHQLEKMRRSQLGIKDKKEVDNLQRELDKLITEKCPDQETKMQNGKVYFSRPNGDGFYDNEPGLELDSYEDLLHCTADYLQGILEQYKDDPQALENYPWPNIALDGQGLFNIRVNALGLEIGKPSIDNIRKFVEIVNRKNDKGVGLDEASIMAELRRAFGIKFKSGSDREMSFHFGKNKRSGFFTFAKKWAEGRIKAKGGETKPTNDNLSDAEKARRDTDLQSGSRQTQALPEYPPNNAAPAAASTSAKPGASSGG